MPVDELTGEEPLYEAVEDIFNPAKKKEAQFTKEQELRLIFAVKSVIGNKEGREFIWWMLSRCDLFASTYTGRALDQAYLDGQRTIGAEILALCLKADPKILPVLIAEYLEREMQKPEGEEK